MFLCRKKGAGREEVIGWLAKSAGQTIRSGVCFFVEKKGQGEKK